MSELIDRIWAAMMNPSAEDGWFLCGLTFAACVTIAAATALVVGPWTLGMLWLLGVL